MEWTIEYLEDKKVLYIKLFGNLLMEKIAEMCKDGVAEAEKRGVYNVLLDQTLITSPLHTLDIYKMPALIEKAGVTRKFKIAVLFSKYPDDFYFYETVSENQGYAVRSFESKDKDKAMKWLAEVNG